MQQYLPEKLASIPAGGESGVFQFDITGAGTWTVDRGSGEVREGPHEHPGCKITCSRENWEHVLDKPSSAMQMFMMGKIKASNIGMAAKLQKILG